MEWLSFTPQRAHERLMAYTATFDPCDLVRAHAIDGLEPRAGRMTNFLGTVVDPAYFGDALQGKSGVVGEVAIPGNWHACVAEWGACLRALDLAQKTFTVIELGCGWGCWLNNMAVAARNVGMQYELTGVEGDSDHIALAKKHFRKTEFHWTKSRYTTELLQPWTGMRCSRVRDPRA